MFGQKDWEEVLGKNLLFYIFLPCRFSAQQLGGVGRKLLHEARGLEGHRAWKEFMRFEEGQSPDARLDRYGQTSWNWRAESQRWSCTVSSVSLSACAESLIKETGYRVKGKAILRFRAAAPATTTTALLANYATAPETPSSPM